MKISLVIPAYNEEGRIERLLQDTHKVFERNGYKGDIIVVNDCSDDATLSICRRLQQGIRNLRIVTHATRSGKTKAVLSGLEHLRTPYMLMIDADYQYDPEDIPKLVNKLRQGYKIVSGWRFERKDPRLRLLLSAVFNVIDRVLFGIRIHDINCGLKAFDASVFSKLEFRFDHFFIDTELLAHAYKNGFPMTEVKVRHYARERDRSKINVVGSSVDIFINCFKLRFSGPGRSASQPSS